MKVNQKERRNFIRKAAAFTGTVYLMPNMISCSDDDLQPIAEIPSERGNFYQGVASFDPDQNGVLLWTRFVPEQQAESSVSWQLASDEGFSQIIRSGEVTAESSRDYTITIEVRDLEPGMPYYYRFFSRDEQVVSATGITRTLPGADNADDVILAVCSCGNYTMGYFNAYQAMGESHADMVLHLGDYIYEYADIPGSIPGRSHRPDRELLNLDDYRMRYRQYREDPQLQELHRLKPFLIVWDDHEVADGAFANGAGNHDPDEGAFQNRKANAVQAHAEYLPVRTDQQGKIWRHVTLGNLADLYLLDTRHDERSQPLKHSDYLNTAGNIEVDELRTSLSDPSRRMMSDEQRAWLFAQAGSSQAGWRIIAQQVLFSRQWVPAVLYKSLSLAVKEFRENGAVNDDRRQEIKTMLQRLILAKSRVEAGEDISDEDRQMLEELVPYNLDAWDGYPAERHALLNRQWDDLVILAGDSHNAWYNKVQGSDERIGAHELATAGVTSPGFEALLNGDNSEALQLEQALRFLLDETEFVHIRTKGYLQLRISAERLTASWFAVDNISSTTFGLMKINEVIINH
ncbi:alkaline phosphatase D family protein [Robertkochia aurantiaca]|uniref:alkaline phosphatase D family protein n=1 Tax=Robertkochia aurantiaca TaxID=2873700 RepID=UPI001CCF6AE7|nr:alkaline phosphatase D family protein [Robertkochia sp. 3YJGBD-33]